MLGKNKMEHFRTAKLIKISVLQLIIT